MATGQMSGVLQHFRRAALLRDGDGISDGRLLERFLTRRDEAAFEALVRRHGPMVLGVCRRVLGNEHDAEDAFQATFFVLVRKAASLLPRENVGNWLYGVAYHTALKARSAAARRRVREAQVKDMPRRAAPTDDTGQDWRPLLDRELSRLPDRYREPVVLCDLEGKTRKEAARQLGVAEGTLSGRLTTARRKLAARLARRGLTLSAGALAAVLSQNAASAGVPAPLVVSTVKAAALLAAGETAAAVASVSVAAITEGVLKAMLMTKLKIAAVLLATICVLALGGGALHQSLAATPANPQAASLPADAQDPALVQREKKEQPKDGAILKGKLGAIDTKNRTVRLDITNERKGATVEVVLPVAKDAVILQDEVKTKLEDLKKGLSTTVKVDQKTAVSITVHGPSVKGKFKSTNAERNTITVIAGRNETFRTLHLLKTTKVTLAGGKAGTVQDLKVDSEILLILSAQGDNTVIRIEPAPPSEKKRNEE